MRRRPVAVYRVIDEVELLGDAVNVGHGDLLLGPHDRLLDGVDDPDWDGAGGELAAGVAGAVRRWGTLALLVAGASALLSATLLGGAASHAARPLPHRGAIRLVRSAVRAPALVADAGRRHRQPIGRVRAPRRSVRRPTSRAPRPPRVTETQTPTAPAAAAPATPPASPAHEFGFER